MTRNNYCLVALQKSSMEGNNRLYQVSEIFFSLHLGLSTDILETSSVLTIHGRSVKIPVALLYSRGDE